MEILMLFEGFSGWWTYILYILHMMLLKGHLHTFALSPGAGVCPSTVFFYRIKLDTNVAASFERFDLQNTVVFSMDLDGDNNDPAKTLWIKNGNLATLAKNSSTSFTGIQ